MGLTKMDKDVFAAQLGDEVEQFLEDFTQDWQASAQYALNNANDPQDDDSNRDWWISFLGNMLWAATAFFPAGGMVQTLERGVAKVVTDNGIRYLPKVLETPSNWGVATKAASLLGAAGGSNVVGQAAAAGSGKWPLAAAKSQLTSKFAAQRGPLKKAFVDGAKDWVSKVLLPHALQLAGIKDGDSSTRDSATIRIFGTAQRDERRSFTWGSYIFPATPAYSENKAERSSILGDYMTTQIEDALNDFNRQWHAYQLANVWAGKARRPPFDCHLNFNGIPAQLQPAKTKKRSSLRFE